MLAYIYIHTHTQEGVDGRVMMTDTLTHTYAYPLSYVAMRKRSHTSRRASYRASRSATITNTHK